MRYVIILGLLALIAALAVPSTSSALQLPPGTYQQTCRDVQVRGSSLMADCQDASGNWRRTELHDYQRCGSDIQNINGNLQCGGYGGAYPPGRVDHDRDRDHGQGYYGPSGSYQQTCRNIQVRGNSLTADCQDASGNLRRTELHDYQRCGSDIQNINGNLQCAGYGGAYPGRPDRDHHGPGYGYYGPRGSYQQTCQNIQVSGNTLRASCQKKNGKWKNTSLNNYQYCRGDIQNDNGKLRCR